MGFAASKHQRAKVAGWPCISCGKNGVDPAHVLDRSLGGCDDALCVVPLCREPCHRLYDEGKLDLLPVLEADWKPELAHAVTHAGLLRVLQRVSNVRWAPTVR